MEKQILDKILDIERVLSKYRERNLSLLDGTSGIAIFYYHLYDLTKDECYLDKCGYFLEYSARLLSSSHIRSTFCNGYTGLAWAFDYLNKKDVFENLNDNDLLADLDPAIYKEALNILYSNSYDFLHGPIGAVLYALGRPNGELKRDFIGKFLKKIDSMKEIDCHGYKWPDISNPRLNTRYAGTKIYNLGLAHGMQSIIEILRRIYEQGFEQEIIKDLVNGSVSYILSQKILRPDKAIFPSAVLSPPQPNSLESSRLSWCYGDLTMALLLWNCAETFYNESWKSEAIIIMENCKYRIDALDNRFLDACICHGTAGIAHIFKKFNIKTHENIYNQRSSFWIKETLNLGKRNYGAAGYRLYKQSEKNNVVYHRWENSYGILEGIAGIGLTLISQLTNDTSWDQCLLLD